MRSGPEGEMGTATHFFFAQTRKESLNAGYMECGEQITNRPIQVYGRHLGGGAVAAKITANVWEIVQLSTLATPLLYKLLNPYLSVVCSFKILITIVLAEFYSFCFEDTMSLSIPFKRHDFCQTPLYNSGVARFES